MVYVVGIAGFIFGFMAGLAMIGALLRGHSNKEIVQNNSLKWTYGLLTWIVAGAGSWMAVLCYRIFFPA